MEKVEIVRFCPPQEVKGDARYKFVLDCEANWGIRHRSSGALYLGPLAPTFLITWIADDKISIHMVKKGESRKVFEGHITKKEVIGGWELTITMADLTTITLNV